MTKIAIAVLLISIIVACGLADTNSKSEPKSDECVRFTFGWIQLENVLYTEKIRHIEIFMDPKAFSEDNLKKLFLYLSSANPNPQFLTVKVYTDWYQVGPSAPNCPGYGISEQPADPHEYDHLQATFWRRGERLYFEYSPKINVDQSEFSTVVLHK